MKWSWKIGRFAGIDTEVHATFLLLLAWVAYGALTDGGTWALMLFALLFLVGVFASVVMHELGHALTARAYGIQTRRILLLPIGGMAQLEGMPRNPRAELAIALAGPLVSFALAAFLMLASLVLETIAGGNSLVGVFVGSLMWANLMLAAFNMIPAFPMDGGRALRAWLATKTSHLRATEIAVRIARFAAFGLGIVSLVWNPWLLVIAVFVWTAASAELRMTRLRQRWIDVGAPEVSPRGWPRNGAQRNEVFEPLGATISRADVHTPDFERSFGGRQPFHAVFWYGGKRRF